MTARLSDADMATLERLSEKSHASSADLVAMWRAAPLILADLRTYRAALAQLAEERNRVDPEVWRAAVRESKAVAAIDACLTACGVEVGK